MTAPVWSHPSLSSRTNSSEQVDSPNSPRGNPIFRSYRNLPNSMTGYNSRISLNSNLPNASVSAYRSPYLPSDLPAFWLQRSSSVRNIPFNHLDSVNNLAETAPIAEDNRFLQAPRLSVRRPGSNEELQSSNMDQHNLSNPCHVVDDLLNRRMQNSSLRFAQSVEAPFGLGASETEISLTNRSNQVGNGSANYSSPDEPLDRSIIFTNPNMNATNNGSLSLRNLALESTPRNNTPSRIPYPRNTTTIQNRGIRRRVPRETMDNIRVNNSGQNANNPRYRERSLLYGGPIERRLSVPVRAAYRSRLNHSVDRPRSQYINSDISRSIPADREIQVRNMPQNAITRNSHWMNDAPSTTSISGASSIEDLRPPALVTPDLRRVNSQARRFEPLNEVKDLPKSTDDSPSPRGSDDWREDAEGSKDLWRRILISERFADVWFTVGGNQILTSPNSSCIATPDPGAPGGPTSVQKYSQIQICKDLQSRRGSDASHLVSDNEGGTNNASTLSNLTPTEATLTNNEGTDVGSDLDDRTTSRPSESVHPVTRSIPIPNGRGQEMPNVDSNPLNEPLSLQDGVSSQTKLAQHFKRKDSQSTNESLANFGTIKAQSAPPPPCVNSGAREQLVREGSAQPLSMQCEVNRPTCCRFGAHRLILAAASPVFEAMFYGPVAELNSRNSHTSTEYHIPDIHPRAFQSMLLYIYSDEIELDDDLDIVFYVLYAAKKYMLPHLGRHCVEHLKELLTASNVCAMLDRSLFFDEEDLTRRCWHVIDVLASNVLTSPGLLKMDANNLKALLKRDSLNCQESEVFAAVRRWAAAECTRLGLRDVVYNRAQVAADMLRLVRFPTMNLKDFAENVAYSGFLSLEMVRDLFVHITTNNSTQPSKNSRSSQGHIKQVNASNAGCSQSNANGATGNGSTHSVKSTFSGPFPSEPRRGPRLWRCARFTRTGKHLITSNPNSTHQHSIVFQVSTSVFLAGVSLYGSTQIGEQFMVRVELVRFQPKLTTGVASVGTQFHGPGDSMEARSPLDRPAQIQSAPANSTPSRNNSVLEFARFDWSGRPRHPPNPQAGEETVIHIPSDLSRVVGTSSTDNQASANPDGRGESNSLAVAKTQIVSDGSSRVYEVFFPCPVKVVRNQRYVIYVHANHGERLVSASSSSTAMNSSSLYIGLFGRPEVRVPCIGDDSMQGANTSRPECMQKSRRPETGKANINPNPPQNGREISFYFSENADGVDHGEVDRGFLPELLFYTCS